MNRAVKIVLITMMFCIGLSAENNDAVSIKKTDWHGYTKERFTINDKDGNAVFFNFYQPKKKKKPAPCIIAFHGATSSKHEWDELNEYTKGGNLVKDLLGAGYAFVTLDLAFHGEHYLRTDSTNYDIVLDDDWVNFFSKSMNSIDPIISFVRSSPEVDNSRLGLMSYSMGALFSFKVSNNYPCFKTLLAMVPSNGREENDTYSPFNNQKNLSTADLLLIAAEDDEYIPFDDTKWLYGELSSKSKKLLSYKSGHSLPIDYVKPAVKWVKKKL